MIRTFPKILQPDSLTKIRTFLNECEYYSGRESAGDVAREAKNNLQAKAGGEEGFMIQKVLRENTDFHKSAMPLGFGMGIFSKYEVGMSYGAHYDNKYMHTGKGQIRTDISFTLALNEDYEGGELIIDGMKFKPPANSLIMYPSHHLHEVTPITKGVRYAYVNWCQSVIPDEYNRDTVSKLLYALESAKDTETLAALSELYNRLMRQFSSL